MVTWTYQCYDDGKQPNLWQRWYEKHPEAQGRHDAAFDMIEQMDVWQKPRVKSFGKITEVILNGPVAHRIFGFFGSDPHVFIVTGVGYHKDQRYYPTDILKTVVKRRKEIEDGFNKPLSVNRPEAS
jgi:hypothetical protein